MNVGMQKVEHYLVKAQCENQRLHLANLHATQYINPSAVLTSLIGKTVFGSMSSGTLQEILCYTVSSYYKNNLKNILLHFYKKFFIHDYFIAC